MNPVEPVQPPEAQTPGSLTFNGPGNLIAPLVSPPPPVKGNTAAQIRAEKLARALHTCKKKKVRAKRLTCERAARKKFGARQASRGRGR